MLEKNYKPTQPKVKQRNGSIPIITFSYCPKWILQLLESLAPENDGQHPGRLETYCILEEQKFIEVFVLIIAKVIIIVIKNIEKMRFQYNLYMYPLPEWTILGVCKASLLQINDSSIRQTYHFLELS